MAKQDKIRYRGAIPERQHDAFLLALLLALSLNILLVTIQALMPRISHLLQLLAPEKTEQQEDEPIYPFQLIAPDLLDEELNPDMPIDAESTADREARQTEERHDLPEERAYVEEGVDDIFSAPTGNPGPNLDFANAQGDTGEQPNEPNEPIEPSEPIEPLPELPPMEEIPPEPEPIDLAALPVAQDGFFVQETREPFDMPPTEQPITTRPEEFAPKPPAEPVRPRTGRQPTFRRIGDNAPSVNAVSGGAPSRQNRSTTVNLLDNDPSMRLLTHRYGEYMAKVARQLQESLNRVMALTSLSLARGQVKIRFGIAPDGTLSYQETIFPNDGEMTSERLISEQMLREAAPFDEPTARMMEDPLFQKMTVIVNLY